MALTIAGTMVYQSFRMIENDLQSAYERLVQERATREEQVRARFENAGRPWLGDWQTLPESARDLPEADHEQVVEHRINLARSMLRTERLRGGFPERWVADAMGYERLVPLALDQDETERLAEWEADFVPSRISGLAAAILSVIGLPLALILGSIGLFKIRKKLWIENIPTVRPLGIVCGINEVKGQVALPDKAAPLTGPLSNDPCAAYRYRVRIKVGSGKHAHWTTRTDERRHMRFLCSDGEGRALVDPAGRHGYAARATASGDAERSTRSGVCRSARASMCWDRPL